MSNNELPEDVQTDECSREEPVGGDVPIDAATDENVEDEEDELCLDNLGAAYARADRASRPTVRDH